MFLKKLLKIQEIYHAYIMPCLARYTTKDHKLRFGDGKHRFYIELCCGEACEGDVCPKCQVKNQIKVQDVRTFDHGLVTEKYPDESHLYDSSWYHTAVKRFGQPKENDLLLAMEAQRKARAKAPSRTTEMATAPPEVPAAHVVPEAHIPPVAIPEVEKPKRVYKRKTTPKAVEEPKEQTVVPPKPKKEKKERKLVSVIPDTAIVESSDDPLEITDILRIHLRTFKHNSTTYWRDIDREKLYLQTKDGKRGPYAGRWDSIRQVIVKDAVDSDGEESIC